MNEFLFPIIEIILGIVLLFAGGEFFIQGAIFLSLILGIPQIVIGLTVVPLGTSSPELLVSLSSILKGSDSLAASNVIGSNIFNVLVVLGISSLITPLKVKSRIVRRDVPLLMAISCAVWAMSSTGLLTLQAGVFLIFCLILNTIWEINTINEKGEETKDAEPEIEELTVVDALEKMKLGNASALMFRNSKHSGLNMIYKREDGLIGWVDPRGNRELTKV